MVQAAEVGQFVHHYRTFGQRVEGLPERLWQYEVRRGPSAPDQREYLRSETMTVCGTRVSPILAHSSTRSTVAADAPCSRDHPCKTHLCATRR